MLCCSRLSRSSAPVVLALALLGAGCRSTAPTEPMRTSAPSAEAAGSGAAPAAEPASPGAPAAAPAPPYKNTIRWTTASEVDSFGFDVYRGEHEEGPFVRLNAKPIAGAGTSDESHSYAWVDDTIDPAKEYYYYVESISIDGVREKFTPVNRARAKLAPSPAPAP